MPRHLADLHAHTTASDGTLSPAALVEEARNARLGAVGIADHDTVAGLDEALEAGERLDIIVVPAVEINTDYGTGEVHMLGYYIEFRSAELLSSLQQLRDGRLERGIKIVEKLNEIGVNINMDRVREIADGGAIGRPHIARAIVEAGYAGSMNTAFGRYLVRGAPAYVPRYKLTPFQAVEIIREAGGVPVMAHPGSSKHDELIPDLMAAGMQGLEVLHTEHSSRENRHYRRLAQKHGLIATGGSDFHGPDMLKMVPIGHVTVDISVVDQLKETSENNKAEQV